MAISLVLQQLLIPLDQKYIPPGATDIFDFVRKCDKFGKDFTPALFLSVDGIVGEDTELGILLKPSIIYNTAADQFEVVDKRLNVNWSPPKYRCSAPNPHENRGYVSFGSFFYSTIPVNSADGVYTPSLGDFGPVIDAYKLLDLTITTGFPWRTILDIDARRLSRTEESEKMKPEGSISPAMEDIRLCFTFEKCFSDAFVRASVGIGGSGSIFANAPLRALRAWPGIIDPTTGKPFYDIVDYHKAIERCFPGKELPSLGNLEGRTLTDVVREEVPRIIDAMYDFVNN